MDTSGFNLISYLCLMSRNASHLKLQSNTVSIYLCCYSFMFKVQEETKYIIGKSGMRIFGGV